MPLRDLLVNYLDREFMKDSDLLAILASLQGPVNQRPRPHVLRLDNYTWATEIPVSDSKVWLILSAYLTGTATTTFQPRLGVDDVQHNTVARYLGGQVDQNDGYEILFSPGVTQQSTTVLAGIPNQYVAVQIPENLLAFGPLTFTAACAGVPEASTPDVVIVYHEFDVLR